MRPWLMPLGSSGHRRSETADELAADRTLMARVYGGDPSAFDEVLELHWPPVVAYVATLVDSWDTAEDVAQDAFLRLWDRRAEWKPTGSLRGFLYRIARNLAINYRRWLRVRLRSAERIRFDRVSPETPLQSVEQAELRATLEQAIASLPGRRREAFVLSYVHGLPQKEIAEIMGTSLQTVKTQASTA